MSDPIGPARERDGSAPRERRRWTGLALSLAGAVALAVAVLAIDPLRDAVGDATRADTESLRDDMRGTATGIGVLYGVIAVHTFVWYPAEIVDAAAGYVHGFWLALLLVMSGWVAQALAAYAIGRAAARPLLHRFIGRRRFEHVERAIERGGVTLLLAARLVPIVPFSLFSYVAGAARVPVGRFAWTTAVGYLPLTALFIYFGSRLDALSLTDPVIWLGALLLIALLLLTRRLKPLFEHHEAERERA